MSMLITGENGTEFELGLIEEPLDDMQDSEGDDTALILSVRVATRDDEWEETSPCLNLFEVTNLVEWLEAVAGSKPDMPELEMLEPELKFTVKDIQGDRVVLRIGFHLEDRPEEMGVDAATEADHVDVKIERRLLRIAAEELKRDMEEAGVARQPADRLADEAPQRDADLEEIEEALDEGLEPLGEEEALDEEGLEPLGEEEADDDEEGGKDEEDK